MKKREKKEIILITGGVCTGKTTYRKENYSEGYSSIDASDIFIELSKGEYYDFPSQLENEMNTIGLKNMREAIQNDDNIVIELTGSNHEDIEEFLELSKKIGSELKVIILTCDIEEAKQRNENRKDDNISAYFCEPYHVKWCKQMILEYLNKKTKKILYVDMDNVLVDFQSGINQFSKQIQNEYLNREDEIPGIFSKMIPKEGAIESYLELSKIFDTYILSTAPWENETAMVDKLRWVKKYLGKSAYKRLILSHHKNLNKGDYIIDDRDKNGVKDFQGEHIHFGKGDFTDWKSVVNYLNNKA